MKLLHVFIRISRKEKNALLLFVVLMLIVWTLPLWFQSQSSSQDIKIQNLQLAADTIHSIRQYLHSDNYDSSYKKNYDNPIKNINIKLQHFDPNIINSNDWIAMGVSEKTAQTIEKYLSKGGRFKEPEDLLKIWGMPQWQAAQLMPFVLINQTKYESSKMVTINGSSDHAMTVKKIAVNLADSADWESLPGIGPVLASRIIKYRKRLGGFYELIQLKEVYGMNDSLYQILSTRLEIDMSYVRFNVNSVTLTELQQHPYFGKKNASLIINYRNQHGNIKSLEEIQNIIALDEISYKKIKHYLKVETD